MVEFLEYFESRNGEDFFGRSDVVSERKGRVKDITETLSQNNRKN